MYETHFGFHRQPFQCADLSRTFYASESIRRILPQILHTLRSSLGIALVTAPRGAGRTTLLKHLQSVFDQEARTVILPGAGLETSADLQRALLLAALRHAGSPAQSLSTDLSHAGRWNVIEQLRRTIEFWGPVIVLVDDCQLVPINILNELRSFTEEEWNGRGLVRAMVTAPVSFEEELARPVYADFSRRIRCHAFLQPLTTVESVEFLKRHIEAVGGKLPQVLSSDAVELLTLACEGLPRSLSLLADETLLGASELGRKPADAATVRGALARLQHLPYHWNVPADAMHDEGGSEFSMTEHEGSAIEIAPTVSHQATSHSAIVYQSAGVIEFGAPSTDFLPSPAEVALRRPSPPVETIVVTDHVDPDETTIESDPDLIQSASTAIDLPLHVTMTTPANEEAIPEVASASSVVEFDFESMDSPAELDPEMWARHISAPSANEDAPRSNAIEITKPEDSAIPSDFEVGRRFFAASGAVESMEAVDDGQNSAGLNRDQFMDLESAESFVDLADDQDPNSSQTSQTLSEPRIDGYKVVTYSHQPVEYYADSQIDETSPEDNIEAEVSIKETATVSQIDGRSSGSLSLQGFSSRIPVFDRYTWLALGREVPAGRYSVTSSSAAKLSARSLSSLPGEVAGAAQSLESIPMLVTTDADIDRWLSGTMTAPTEGEFLLTPPTGLLPEEHFLPPVATDKDDVAVGVEYYNATGLQELESVRPGSVDDRIASVIEVATAQIPPEYSQPAAFDALAPVMSDENRLLIRDALRSTLRAELDELEPARNELPPPLPSNMTAEAWADGSLVFGRKTADAQPEQTEPSSTETTPTVPITAVPSSADRLFTIPVDLHSIDWDLRSSIMEFPEVAPLAQSVDALRSEVSDFHAAGRSGSDDHASDRVRADLPSTDDESLLAKARRRLYSAALADITAPGTLEVNVSAEERALEAGEATPGGTESDARFSTLFTRLRSMRTYRKDSVE